MEVEQYKTEQLSPNIFQFYSSGPKGRIEIRISFILIGQDLYNLAFGVWNSILADIDDQIETKNGDIDVILGTVAKTTLRFLNDHPTSYVVATGSTPIRSRKYQMGINQNLVALMNNYIIGGFIAERSSSGNIIGAWPNWDGNWFEFKIGINYDAFLLSLK